LGHVAACCRGWAPSNLALPSSACTTREYEPHGQRRRHERTTCQTPSSPAVYDDADAIPGLFCESAEVHRPAKPIADTSLESCCPYIGCATQSPRSAASTGRLASELHGRNMYINVCIGHQCAARIDAVSLDNDSRLASEIHGRNMYIHGCIGHQCAARFDAVSLDSDSRLASEIHGRNMYMHVCIGHQCAARIDAVSLDSAEARKGAQCLCYSIYGVGALSP
jgi:hypothetical protein